MDGEFVAVVHPVLKASPHLAWTIVSGGFANFAHVDSVDPWINREL